MFYGLIILGVLLVLHGTGLFLARRGGNTAQNDLPQTFTPSRWWYIVVSGGFILGTSPIVLLGYSGNRDFMAWCMMSFLSLMFVLATLSLFRDVRTAKLELTRDHLEYRRGRKIIRVELERIISVRIVGAELFIDYGAPKNLRIPLIFKDSGALVSEVRRISGCS